MTQGNWEGRTPSAVILLKMALSPGTLISEIEMDNLRPSLPNQSSKNGCLFGP